MTVDFRDPRSALQAQAPRTLTPQQSLVLASLGFSALLMCAAGVWFWLQRPAWVDAHTAPYLALALALTGVADVAAIALLRWIWKRNQG